MLPNYTAHCPMPVFSHDNNIVCVECWMSNYDDDDDDDDVAFTH